MNTTALGSVVTEIIARTYYKGLPSNPRFIATTKPGRLKLPEAYPVSKELRILGDHPLAACWDKVATLLRSSSLNSWGVDWTSIDAVRIPEVGEPSGPAIIWIGVTPGTIDFEQGHIWAAQCGQIIHDSGIEDCHVEIRGSRVTRHNGIRLLDPLPYHRIFTAREPYTPTLGIPIAPRDNDSHEGTGGFFLGAGGENKKIYLITARHVVLPPTETENVEYAHSNHGQPRQDFIILGKSNFENKIMAVDNEIDMQNEIACKANNTLDETEGMDDAESNETREFYKLQLKETEKTVKALKTLRDEITTQWQDKDDRVIGHVVWAPPVAFSTEPDQYTQDFAVIEIDEGKLDASNFLSNTINLGNNIQRNKSRIKFNFVWQPPQPFHAPKTSS